VYGVLWHLNTSCRQKKFCAWTCIGCSLCSVQMGSRVRFEAEGLSHFLLLIFGFAMQYLQRGKPRCK